MFGMGTGGSLRLLSPETKLSLDAIAAALPGSVGSAKQRPPDSRSSRPLWAPAFCCRASWFRRFGRTVWPRVFLSSAPLLALALSCRAPSKPHREYHPTKMISETSSQISLSVPGLRLGLRSFALPVPCSLLPVPFFPKIKPSTD